MIFSNKIKMGVFAFMLLTVPLKNWAGEATLTGYGEVETPPELISISVQVTSECFQSAKIVSNANDEVANKVLDILKSVAIESNGDEVTATGGYVSRYSGHRNNSNILICQNTFRKVNNITFKTTAVGKFAETFAQLQDEIYALGMPTTPGNFETPVSYLEIGTPQPSLTTASRKIFERKALVSALQDAKEKFETTLSLAGIKKYKIVNYSENAITPRRGLPNEDHGRFVEAPSPAPIVPGNLMVTKYLNVRFQYTGEDLNL